VSLNSGSEFASNPSLSVDPTVGQVFANQFLFLGDTFYFDDRKENSMAIAAQVRDWVDDHTISVPKPLKLVPIYESQSRISDLQPVLGYPYLFQHANDCEHLVVFMDLRVVNMDDPQDEAKYPLLTSKPNQRRVICKACGLYSAKWETRQDVLADEDPAFWCDKCFKTFHYDKKGKKSHEFLAKPFVDPAIVYANI